MYSQLVNSMHNVILHIIQRNEGSKGKINQSKIAVYLIILVFSSLPDIVLGCLTELNNNLANPEILE